MKSTKIIFSVCMTVCLLALSATEIDGLYFWRNGSYTRFDVTEMLFGDDKVSIGDVTFDVSNIDSITFRQPEETAEVVTDTLYITYEGQSATVTPEGVAGITTEINGAAVTLTNEYWDRALTFVRS